MDLSRPWEANSHLTTQEITPFNGIRRRIIMFTDWTIEWLSLALSNRPNWVCVPHNFI
jgi:hypothetical protein